ncbi:MAG: flagellar basal body rod protein FlgB [Planctomycetaceae bacterium]|nr:flagellar basal body rod protein FlgB [Planctomycetaceae bacterium]
MLPFPSHIDQVSTLAQVAELRHRVISHNLANVNTPNYQRLDLAFEEDFLKAVRRGSDHRVVQPEIIEEEDFPVGLDGNNVDLDREVGQLQRNSLLFQTYSQILSAHLDSMRRAMQG